MENKHFADKLYKLRKAENLSQKELSKNLGVTNKAISKWESGVALPSVGQLIRLSEIFNTSIDDLIRQEELPDKNIYKICVTGGPCSGKSTALSYIQREFTKKGYMVMIVPETATELILGGIAPWTIDTNRNFEYNIIKLQMEKEALFEEAARHIANYDKVLIVCDRGILDCKAYMKESEFRYCLKKLGTNETNVRDNYDAVFHLVTVANGKPELYSLENNAARYESIEQAIARDDTTVNCWTGHPHLRLIDNSTDLDGKMSRLLGEISQFLGEPKPFEIERKFLIEYPNIQQLQKLPNCKKVEIVQTYLKSSNNTEIRIRQRGDSDSYTYTKTTKERVSNTKRLEEEKRITKEEYLRLLLQADPKRRTIVKTRYCLMHKGQYLEIDIYPDWEKQAILEVELTNDDQKITLPKFIKVIKEVTDDPSYSNANLAKI